MVLKVRKWKRKKNHVTMVLKFKNEKEKNMKTLKIKKKSSK